jgi:hypothetical protein
MTLSFDCTIPKQVRMAVVSLSLLTAAACSPQQGDTVETPPQVVTQAVQQFATGAAPGDIAYVRATDGSFAATFLRAGKSFRLAISPSGAITTITETVSYAPHVDSAKNAALAAAASPCEDFVEAMLANDATGTRTALLKIEAALGALKGTIDDQALTSLDQVLTSANTSSGAGDTYDAAIAILNLYRRLQDLMDAAALVVPVQVGVLDHAGFKLSVLMTSAAPNWTEAIATAAEGGRVLGEVSSQINERNLATLAQSIVQSAQHAAERQDAAGLRLAASQILAVVDLLERDFEERFKTSGGKAVKAGP